MKLKPIPQNTVVHTPTEAEAKELLAILHKNGWKWVDGTIITESRCIGEYLFLDKENEDVSIMPPRVAKASAVLILTLAEFKERYCEEEKPQPKFKVGDKIRIIQDDSVNPTYVGIVDEIANIGYRIQLKNTDSNWSENVLEPYTEPETMDETMETKELNLCELLQGYEGEKFYSLIAGECRLKEINEGAGFPLCIILDACTTWEYLTKDGKRFNVSDARCILFPSRALYEQYPLDPYTAWMEWKEEQKKYSLTIAYIGNDRPSESRMLTFYTEAQRDKAIIEIQAIINKHSNKNKV